MHTLYPARGESLHGIKLRASNWTASVLSPFINIALTETQQSFTTSVGSVSCYMLNGKSSAFLTVFITVLSGLYSCINNVPMKDSDREWGKGLEEGEGVSVAERLENQMMSSVAQCKD